MSADDPEIIPPGTRLPDVRGDRATVSARQEQSLPRPEGVISSALTGFQARWQARAYQQIAENIRAQKDALDAETARRDSTIKLFRKTGELLDIKDILALDKAERAAERAAKYERLDDDQDERAHQRRLTALRRQREIEEANAKVVQAKRGTFIEKEGLENEKRVKQINTEMFKNRVASEGMEAERVWLLLRREIDGIKSPQQKANEGSLEHLAEMRSSLMQRAQEAAAQGDASKAEQYTHLAAELDALVLAAVRGEGQK
jgi:hypothetical protein